MRMERQDESYVDIAATGREDRPEILVVYYHTLERYTRIFNHSINSLLDGYSLEHNGTIVISENNQIVSSNNKKLIGTAADGIEGSIVVLVMNLTLIFGFVMAKKKRDKNL